MRVAIIGGRDQWPERRLRPASRARNPRCTTPRRRSVATSRPSSVDTAGRSRSPVDMGFIVHNDVTYPTFLRMMAELGVETQASDMSLGSACRACGVEFSSRGAGGWFAQPAAALRPGHWRMFADILRFYRDARARLDDGVTSRATLGDYLDDLGFGPGFRDHFLDPDHIGGVVHGVRPDPRLPGRLPAALPRPPRADRRRPCAAVANDRRRLDDLCRADPRPPRQDAVRAGDPVVDVARTEPGSPSGPQAVRSDAFDAVVMATHADDALRLLRDADAPGAGGARRRSTTRRTESSSTPTRPCCPGGQRAWASWNIDQQRLSAAQRRAHDDLPHEPAAGAPGARSSTSCRSTRTTGWTRARSSPTGRCATRCTRSRRSTRRLASATSRAGDGTFYAGAHLGYGFHEDGCRSGFEAAERITASAAGVVEPIEERAA